MNTPPPEAGPERLNPWWLLLPVLAVMLVFVGVNLLRDRTQLTCSQVTFYAELKPCPQDAQKPPPQLVKRIERCRKFVGNAPVRERIASTIGENF